MKYHIVPRTMRNRELIYDQEMVSKLVNDETYEIEEGFNRRLYQKVAEDLGFRLRTRTTKSRTLVIWFEKRRDKIDNPIPSPVEIGKDKVPA